MDWDERVEAGHYANSLAWAGRFNNVRGPAVASWVSTFRNNQYAEVVGDYCGSFNWSCKVRFEDGVQWIVRFAVSGRVMNGDEKIRHEAATMQFIKENTDIPMPSIIAWGSSDDNPLDLGPFIIMEFIEGEPLDMILRRSNGPEDAHTLSSDITDQELETIYRQVANILLELSVHDFSQIGSLSSDTDISIHSRPLTLKMNEIRCHGGVSVGSPSTSQSPSLTIADRWYREHFENIFFGH
jgi:hypothetical protein